ncbi:hypothetical protein [Marisediminitalea sp.]|mgnify:FL=1|uniref:hypothetical protein n=1 Tax=Marisediminitalea sp. TaxID=2662268 RepID=UPI000C648155|nr:hypothetical protein [Alteromonadaceae bacterium]MAX42062.1 hypothetical protein [Alteromonadaceae bacterium]HBY38565.1 hypothetical protein [Alteromonas sp.]|tara:strand:- start:3516 stop:3809 length:294 start_codon:yes stop_codon:yes gene_type:complete
MSIKTIIDRRLKEVWVNDDLSVFPSLYNFEIRTVLFDLDAADVITDLHDIGAVQFNPDDKRAYSVTITVNNIEPCGAVICDFWDGNCYNIDFREYNP